MIELRPFQDALVHKLREAVARGVKRILLVSPTGSGKTVMFAYLVSRMAERGVRSNIMVHRQELLDQVGATLTRFECKHSYIAASEWYNPRPRIHVSSVFSLAKRMNTIPVPDYAITDECFPADTFVDGRRICEYQIGDSVRAVNHDTNTLEESKVTRLFKSEYCGDWYRAIMEDGRAVVCTAGHPFYAEGCGYVPIRDLQSYGASVTLLHDLRYLREREISGKNSKRPDLKKTNLLLTEVPRHCPQGSNKTNPTSYPMQAMRTASVLSKNGNMVFGSKERLRNSSLMPVYPYERTLFSKNAGNKFEASCQNLTANEKSQPNVFTRNKSENGGLIKWTNILSAWWKWAIYKAAEIAFGNKRSSNGVCYSNCSGQGEISEFTVQLQSGFGSRRIQTSNRSRWKDASIASLEIFGCKEDRDIGRIRLASVEVYKRGSSCRPEWVPSGDTVYNLEIDKYHNYFANGILVHNCHHCIKGSTWAKCLDEWRARNPKLVAIGVTATPERLDGTGLRGMWDEMIVGPGVAELIELGFLCRYKMFAPAHQLDKSELHTRAGEYKADEVEVLMRKPAITGNAVAHYRKYLNGAPTIAFCVSRKHAFEVAEDFKAAGFRSANIDGTMSKPDRRQMVQDFSNGQLSVMTSCMLINEGFDVPGMHGAILLNPTQSLAKYLQECGRALRIAPGKECAYILDHVGNSAMHGLPCEDRTWSLDSVSRSKRSNDSEDISIRQCRKCGAVCRATAVACVECGHVFEIKPRVIKEVEGELSEVDVELMRRQKLREQGQADSLETLIALGKMRGMKNPFGWASHVMQARSKKVRKHG